MAVSVRIPTQLRELAGGASEVEVEGANVAEVLAGLEKLHPGFAERLHDTDGSLRRFVNVFVADEDIRFLQGKVHKIVMIYHFEPQETEVGSQN